MHGVWLLPCLRWHHVQKSVHSTVVVKGCAVLILQSSTAVVTVSKFISLPFDRIIAFLLKNQFTIIIITIGADIQRYFRLPTECLFLPTLKLQINLPSPRLRLILISNCISVSRESKANNVICFWQMMARTLVSLS